ncbi:hypothetical protein BH23ACT10_BH23ACT10_03820 [soil metagenome]
MICATVHPMSAENWAALFDLAARQYGAVARWQASGAVGITSTVFTSRVRRERWYQPHRGVFVIPGTVWGPMPRLSAALLAVGPHAAATAMTALHLHGVVDEAPKHPTLVVPHGRRASRSRSIRVLRTRTLQDDDLTTVDGLRCATPPRAFMDASPVVAQGGQRILLINARQRGVAEPAEILIRATAAPARVPGRDRLISAAVDVMAVGADSPLSDTVHRRLIADGLRPDDHPVAVDVGGRWLHPDITFAAARVCIECDSLAYHRDQRAIDLDHRKDQSYSAAGWRCLRIGWRRYELDWAGFVSVVRSAVDEWPRVRASLGV